MQFYNYLFSVLNVIIYIIKNKVSEALEPNVKDNHIGKGGTMDEFIAKQKGIRLIINGGFNHYRKDFYHWKQQEFNIGNPVGLLKIREHYFEDFITIEQYGFFIQEEKNKPWKIIQYQDLKRKKNIF